MLDWQDGFVTRVTIVRPIIRSVRLLAAAALLGILAAALMRLRVA
jgi:hypothetical protein